MIGVAAKPRLASKILDQMLCVLAGTPACHEPFSHIYFENFFPADVYADLLAHLPDAACYTPLCVEKHARADGTSTRDVMPLFGDGLAQLPPAARELWQAAATALASPELKRAVFHKLAPDLARRFGMGHDGVDKIVTHCKPSLYRDLEGYEIPPHPDGRAKIVTMQLYLPRDRSQIELGTALYERRLTSLRGVISWRGRFRKVKQFPFLPNSGYAFAVSNSFGRKSWHGRETLPEGAGVRHSIFNLYFASDDRTY